VATKRVIGQQVGLVVTLVLLGGIAVYGLYNFGGVEKEKGAETALERTLALLGNFENIPTGFQVRSIFRSREVESFGLRNCNPNEINSCKGSEQCLGPMEVGAVLNISGRSATVQNAPESQRYYCLPSA